jgi:hypothetical protein
MSVDPIEFPLQFFVTEEARAEHSQAACLADFDDYIAAMREGKDWIFDSEGFGQLSERILHFPGSIL